jgi:hypothetical protein
VEFPASFVYTQKGNMKQTKWFERKFDFSSSQNIFPALLERLAGTPARLEEKIKSISPPYWKRNPMIPGQ